MFTEKKGAIPVRFQATSPELQTAFPSEFDLKGYETVREYAQAAGWVFGTHNLRFVGWTEYQLAAAGYLMRLVVKSEYRSKQLVVNIKNLEKVSGIIPELSE